MSDAAAVIQWYDARLRPLLARNGHNFAELAALDEGMSGVQLGRRAGETHVAVIGEAGVGKSTLLNALLSERLPILPQGGVGPYTAAPVEIRYAANPFVRFRCWGRERIRELLEAVQSYSSPGTAPRDRKLTAARRQMARLLVGGSQFADLTHAEMTAFLNACLDGSGALDARLSDAQAIVERGGSSPPELEIEAGVDLPRMLAALADHATGFLAPLTASIELGWDAPFLREGLVLTDLPGLGVANDAYRDRTSSELPRMDALLWVVDRAGLTQSSIELLHRTGFLARLLEAAEKRGRTGLMLMVAVTKLDQSVTEAIVARRNAGQRVSWTDARTDCAHRALEVVRAQLAFEIARGFGSSSVAVREAVVAHTPIHAAFPRDYQCLNRAEPEEPTSLASVMDSGVPTIRAQLSELCRARNVDLLMSCKRALAALMRGPARTESRLLAHELRDLEISSAGLSSP